MKNKITMVLILLLNILISGISYASQNQGVNPMLKPFYNLKINISGCTYKILVNDVPVLEDLKGMPLDSSQPLNEWLKNGSNTFTIILGKVKDSEKLEQFGQQCKGSVKFQVKNAAESKNHYITLNKINFSSNPNQLNPSSIKIETNPVAGDYIIKGDSLVSSKNGEIVVRPIKVNSSSELNKKDKTVIKGEIKLTNNLPLWSWFNSERIEDNNTTKDELIQQYQKIWNALKHDKINSIETMFQDKAKELSEAYYVSENSINMFDALKKANQNSELSLVTFMPQYAKLKVFGDGHLAELTTWDGHSNVIAYNYKDIDANASFQIIFMKKYGKWVIIR